MTLTLAAFSLLGSWAAAVERPPEELRQQRVWLARHLLADMQTLGAFGGMKAGQIETLVRSLEAKEARLLSDFYYLSRKVAERDLQQQLAQARLSPTPSSPSQSLPPQLAAEPLPLTPEEAAQAKADRDELLRVGRELELRLASRCG